MIKKTLRTTVAKILEWEARLVVKKYKPRIVGITGNAGKTSTKEAVALVLNEVAQVRKSEKSYNSEFGLPLTILGCESGWNNPLHWLRNIIEGLHLIVFPHHYPEWLVLELGADRPGDIARVATWLPLEVAIITTIGELPVHVEFFPSVESLVEEKANIMRALTPNGVLVLNSDDPRVITLKTQAHTRVVSFGFDSIATVHASNSHTIVEEKDGVLQPRGVTFKVDYSGKSFPLRLDEFFGEQNIYPALAAIATGVALDVPLATIIHALSHFRPPRGRLHMIEGIKQSVVIDDTYNASPAAMQLALASLKNASAKRRIAVLGDMLELGEHTLSAHEAVGITAYSACDLLITVGPRAKFIAESARKAGMAEERMMHFFDSRTAGQALDPLIEPGDVILVKGSQMMRMERCVEEIMLHPEDKEHLLVRQEKEWQRQSHGN